MLKNILEDVSLMYENIFLLLLDLVQCCMWIITNQVRLELKKSSLGREENVEMDGIILG